MKFEFHLNTYKKEHRYQNRLVVVTQVQDEKNSISIKIYDGEKVKNISDMTASIEALKPNTKLHIDECVIVGNQIVYDIPLTLISQCGEVVAYIALYDKDNKCETTQKFSIVVLPSMDGEIDERDYISTIGKIIDEAKEGVKGLQIDYETILNKQSIEEIERVQDKVLQELGLGQYKASNADIEAMFL